MIQSLAYQTLLWWRGGRTLGESASWQKNRQEKAKVPPKDILATKAITFIRMLCQVERKTKDVTPKERLTARKEKSVPALADFNE